MELQFELISFIVAISSIILAILSLIFSVLFYRWSDKSNRQTYELSKGIEGNTKKIEDLFDKFYSDTFGLMKSNYEAMQSSIFNQTTISSGDSTYSEEEQIENIITSLIVKSKILTREAIWHFIDKMYPAKHMNRNELNRVIDDLHKNGLIIIKNNLISISSTKEGASDEGDSEQ